MWSKIEWLVLNLVVVIKVTTVNVPVVNTPSTSLRTGPTGNVSISFSFFFFCRAGGAYCSGDMYGGELWADTYLIPPTRMLHLKIIDSVAVTSISQPDKVGYTDIVEISRSSQKMRRELHAWGFAWASLLPWGPVTFRSS